MLLAFRIGGVSEGAGRVPTAILGWLTLAVTYCAAKWLFNARAGFFAAAALLGSYYFARHFRLAETDAPATLFVTLAIYALWRATDRTNPRGQPLGFPIQNPQSKIQNENAPSPQPFHLAISAKNGVPDGGVNAWLHLGAFAMGMAVLSKGPPALFAVLFFVAHALIERKASVLLRFFTSGAIVTVLLIAAPWFLFVAHHEGWSTFITELRTVEAGTDHGASVIQYVPWFVVGTLPWTIVILIAMAQGVKERRDAKVRGLIVWFCAIALPLCVTGNKQSHYLLPLMPVSMILAAWMIDRWRKRWLDIAAIAVAVLVPLIVTIAIPRIVPQHNRQIAAFVREKFDRGPFCFYGPNASVPLCFNLHQRIDFANDAPELEEFLARDPKLVIITIGKDLRPASAPAGDRFEHLSNDTYKVEDQVWDFYRLKSRSIQE